MKKAGMKKGKNKEFSTPYTVTNAVTKGNIITKLSLLIMGYPGICAAVSMASAWAMSSGV